MAAVAEAYRNLSCVGAEPVAVTDCLNFGNPEKPDAYYQLAECIEGMAEACEVFGTPVVSGNVSLYNETERGAIYPTPTVGMVGVFEDVSRHATPGFKREGDMVVVLNGGFLPNESRPPRFPFAGSDYLEVMRRKVAGQPSRPHLVAEKRASDLIRGMIRSGLIDTAHDVSRGGELLALAKMALLGGIGFEFTPREVEYIHDSGHNFRRLFEILFGEEGNTFLIAFPWERWDDVQEALGIPDESGVSWAPYDEVGFVGGDRFKVGEFVDLSLDELRRAYDRDLFEQHAPAGGHLG
jgi:phosphoribosylformylglycinamidine synthase